MGFRHIVGFYIKVVKTYQARINCYGFGCVRFARKSEDSKIILKFNGLNAYRIITPVFASDTKGKGFFLERQQRKAFCLKLPGENGIFPVKVYFNKRIQKKVRVMDI